jgi:hypothetical protein
MIWDSSRVNASVCSSVSSRSIPPGAPPRLPGADVTAETYDPLPISDADLHRLKTAFRDHAPHLELDLGDTDTAGLSCVSVTVPRADFDEAPPIITRGEVKDREAIIGPAKGPDGASKLGWQMRRAHEGCLPLAAP